MTMPSDTPPAVPPSDWWNGGASPEVIRATAGRLLAFISKHAGQTPEEMPLLHDVHVLQANARQPAAPAVSGVGARERTAPETPRTPREDRRIAADEKRRATKAREVAQQKIGLPRWIFGHVGDRFLVAIEPDGIAHVDGGHAAPSGVATARDLFQRLAIIRPPDGTRYVMLTVEEVPSSTEPVNDEAIRTLNAMASPRAPEQASPSPTPLDVGEREEVKRLAREASITPPWYNAPAYCTPDRISRLVAEVERAEEDAARDYAVGFMAGHAAGVFEPGLSADDVWGAAWHEGRKFATPNTTAPETR